MIPLRLGPEMSESKDRHEEIFRRIVEAVPVHQPSEGANDTVDLLIAIGAAWPGPLSSELEAGLDALCRKLAVTRKVMRSYGLGWNRAIDTEPLPDRYWEMLIAVLLARFGHEEASEYKLGIELKRLNAAYMAIDITKGLDWAPDLKEIESWAGERLDELTGN